MQLGKIRPITRWLGLGILVGTFVWAWGLDDGFHQGFEKGIQRLETGEVQVLSKGTGFGEYFQLRALIEGIPGVAAASAQLEFLGKVTNHSGQSRTISVRAFTFSQEHRVTKILSRVRKAMKPLESGLLIPNTWAKEGFLDAHGTATIQLLGDKNIPLEVPIVGILERTYALDGKPYAVLDLEHAHSLLQNLGQVTSFDVSLAPGIDPATWVARHKSAFSDSEAELVTGSQLARAAEQNLIRRSGLYFGFQKILITLSWAGLALLAWFVPVSKERFWRRLGAGAVAAGLAFLAWQALFSVGQGLLTQGFLDGYPYVGSPKVPWGWGADVIWWTLATIAAVAALSGFRQRIDRRLS